MTSICGNLTQEVNQLVANGKAVDDLLVLATSVENSKVNISNNLIAYNATLTGTALRAN